ncbi:hypothetical protein SEUCBS140593_005590 [Sporothrix eucalyptigena]|uniref:3-phytase n=1 Tax=Sporothrix eucalyptigena TaxID=1812306 RepID=A0ABP0BXQ4_9PEZI
MANPVSSLVGGVRSLFDGSQHHYEPLPPYSATDEGNYDYEYEYDDDNDRRRRQGATAYDTNSAGGRRAREPLLYIDPSDVRGSSRRRGMRPSRVSRFAASLDSDFKDGVLDSVWARGNRRFLKLTLLATVAVLLFYLGVLIGRMIVSSMRRGQTPASCDTTDHGYQCYPTMAQNWGQYAPFFSVSSEIQSSDGRPSRRPVDSSPFAPPPDPAANEHIVLPSGCHFTFAQVLSRHGGRDPTSGKSDAYGKLIARILKKVDKFEDGPDGAFAFLEGYTYRLGADELTRFGELQMVHSGAHFYHRYRSLLQSLATKKTHVDPFVRSADQHRVVLSAINWIQGFQAARRSDDRGHSESEKGHIVLLPEAAGFNNTLSYNGLCKRFSSHAGSMAQRAFAETFVPAITARLNRGLPKADLSDTETIYLMDLCPFETIADEEADGADGETHVIGGGRRLSPFCHLFTEAEWRDYDYYQTLGKWYGFGDGSALGATQGVGFVNELIARLTSSPVVDHTSTNSTMDSNPATFPLDAHVYADFSHDNDMANIFAALGLYNGTAHPSNTTYTPPEDLHGYAASWTVPFAARMYVEKMTCNSNKDEEFVRILVNDRIMPLPSCGGDQYGRCRLSQFVDSLEFARSGGHWDDCFA